MSGGLERAPYVVLACLLVVTGCNPVEADYISCKQEAEKALAKSQQRPEVVHSESLELAAACMRRRGYQRDDERLKRDIARGDVQPWHVYWSKAPDQTKSP
ncbi:MAG TPA: hypothetical protein VGO08_12890 [Burkholderiales bacterium]|nr:hypothetical protein [Burkholderiales bacterium]